MPPSPRLSARRMKTQYLIEMTMISDHRIRDNTPSIATGPSPPRLAACEASFNA